MGAELAWLLSHTIGCGAAVDVGGSVQQWTCSHDDAEGTPNPPDHLVYRVVVRGNARGVTALMAEVDQTRDLPATEDVTGFFAKTIAGSPATGAANGALEAWFTDHTTSGGQATVDGIRVSLGPRSPDQTVSLAWTSGP